jgi:sugar phosphate isomerase/epimerase
VTTVRASSVWTLSGFGDEIDADPVVQLAVLRALGAGHIEVRSAWGTNVVEMSDEELSRLSRLVKSKGMAVSAVASPVGKSLITADFADEMGRFGRAVAAAHRLETRYIRIFSFYRPSDVPVASTRDEVLRRLSAFADVAARAGLVLVHENEKEIYGDIPDRVRDIVESIGSDALRVAWDNANFVQVGVKPYTDGYRMLRPHLEYLQVKDALFGSGTVVPAGEGDGELLETLTALRDDGYTGFASLEPHLASQSALGGFSGPGEFGVAARAFAALTGSLGVRLV